MTTATEHDPTAEVPPLGREAAADLADRICDHAARQARDSCDLLILIGEFDAGNGWAWTDGFTSVAHWLAWTCSMTQGTAREHIRVARALRRMPTVTAAFGAGELSYSKVRELTRIVDLVDEARLCALARYATASQLARMISSFRAAAGSRIKAESRRLFRLISREDSMTGITGRLPTDEAAILSAAVQRARHLNSTPTPATPLDPDEHDATPRYTDADALLDVCRHYLATAATADESGEDRSLVIVEVAAEQLDTAPQPLRRLTGGEPEIAATKLTGGEPESAAAEVAESEPNDAAAEVAGSEAKNAVAELALAEAKDVPAGTPPGAADPEGQPPNLRGQVCTIRGSGPIEPRTAQRLICTGSVLGAIVDQHGDVLALGRTRRLVSKRQRRALLIRDRMCQYPGCSRERKLQAHHRIPWSHGGTTDLTNLILLCGFHHTAVHEGGVTIIRRVGTPYFGGRTGEPSWQFLLPGGEPVAESGWRVMTADHLIRRLTSDAESGADHHDHSAASIGTVGGGEGFSLHNCVEALFGMIRGQDREAA